MQVADYLISSGRCAQLDIEVGMCEQDTRIEEVVLRAVQRLGFGFANIFSAAIRVRRIAWL